MTTHHRSVSGENPLYRLNGANGQACILLQTDAVIAIKYRTVLGEDRVRIDLYLSFINLVLIYLNKSYKSVLDVTRHTYV